MTDPLSQWLDEMDEKAKAATPGPWHFLKLHGFCVVSTEPKASRVLNRDVVAETSSQRQPDAAYIAALPPETVQALIDCVRAAALASDEIQSQHRAWPGEVDTLADAIARLRRRALGDA